MSSVARIQTKIPAEKLKEIKKNYQTSPPHRKDKKNWLNMWADYSGSHHHPDAETLEYTWKRLLDPEESFNGIFLYQRSNKKLVGFSQYILHPSTWHKGLTCYIEDAYILKDHRQTGAMIALYDALLDRAAKQKWSELYWMTRQDNITACRFYDRFAKRTNWIRYEYNLSDKNE